MIFLSYTQKRHSKEDIRHEACVHIKRKEKILKNVYDAGNGECKNNEKLGSYYGYTKGKSHRLSKGKIHCSCPMCREKTKERGWKHADIVNMMKGIEDERE